MINKRNILKSLIIFILTLIIISCGDENLTKVTKNVKFIEDSAVNISNPDRGFYDATYSLNENLDYNMFKYAKEDGYNLVYAQINLEDYIETEILPDELINIIENNLKDAEEFSVKLILRVKYRDSMNGKDPSLVIIKGHLNQLKPILQAHKEIISIVQAGTIGAWGEWHAFTGDFNEENINYKANRKKIIEKLIEIFPNKYIQIRTPMHKELLYGSSVEYRDEADDAKISPEIAFTSDIRAKIGHHNDCFLASLTDMGTYPSDNIDFWKDYVVNDSKYSPVGGETCNIETNEDAYLTSCENALKELKKFRYSYLNDAYHQGVLEKWKSEGCYQEIKENLGYRLVANKLNIEESTKELSVSLSITNKGYAAPYINSKITFVLASETNNYSFTQKNIDLRKFYSQETNEIKANLPLKEIKKGDYCLYLQIGDKFSFIKLSNHNIWSEANRANILNCNIKVE